MVVEVSEMCLFCKWSHLFFYFICWVWWKKVDG